MSNQYTEKEIRDAIEVIETIRLDAIADKDYGFDLPFKSFLARMRLLTPQSSSARITRYIYKSSGWSSVSPNEDSGDLKDVFGNHVEAKLSLITSYQPAINIVQIRLWQNVDFYHIFCIDTRDGKDEVIMFILPKKEMKKECEALAHSAHGTKKANTSNEKVELRISIVKEDSNPIYASWLENYGKILSIK